MVHKNTINSEDDIRKDFLRHFKQYKVFKQNSFYFDGGASNYYHQDREKRAHMFELCEKYYPFLQAHALDKDNRIALVSLGCGNSEKERFFLDKMHADGYEFIYVGVDSSAEMIDMSDEIMNGVPYSVELVHADFSREEAMEHVRSLIAEYDTRIYSFIGATLGNVEQDYIADILYDLLQPGDKLWLEVVIRQSKNEKDDRLLFERYLEYLNYQQEFFFTPLRALGVPMENGEMFLQMLEEESLGSLRFTFRFRFFKKTIVMHKGRTITLLPGTVVDLISIRAYDPVGLANFFEERKFIFRAKICNKKMGQFLLEKA